MKRRNFLIQSSLTATGLTLLNSVPSFARSIINEGSPATNNLYEIFTNPPMQYRPYVRWWWNGDKIERTELARELRILKDAGIGGVEINSISFPARTDDMGIPSIEYLSDEWIALLQFTLLEARSLGMTCDLLVGTGFPMGGEFLEGEERSQVAVIGVKKLEGPLETEFSVYDLYKEADPAITNPYDGRTMEMLEIKLVPDPLDNIEQVVTLTGEVKDGILKINIPKGKFALYALVKITGFMKVIQGNPGGRGPVLNHFNGTAVKKYLNHISGTIQNKIGPLEGRIRSFFVDSLETEGTNWTSTMMAEFKKRRGYDLYPYLPFVLFRTGGMGNTYDSTYTVDTSEPFKAMIERIRYDFEFTKAEIFQENFVHNFAQWCTQNKVKSRAQAYGRGYFPLEGSFEIDIPECETWIKYGIGEDISEADFTKYPWHLGQGNTMINKIVSSAAHLKDKKLISSEELTNTAMVFNESLEIYKIAGDQSTISGVTHPIFHGFNYSPKNAAFPGWITYGGYLSEKNTMWPYFKKYTDYRARISALLQQATMFADIAVMAPFPDQWGAVGAQNEPFPTVVSPNYQMLIWESIHQNGNACDYISEQVINDSEMKDGSIQYGHRKYHTLFLIEVRSLNPTTAKKLYEFVANGGRVFCIEAYPEKSLGWNNYIEKDKEVKGWVEKMKGFSDRFIFLNKPEENFLDWYRTVQVKHNITPYVKLATLKPYVTQVRYQAKDVEIFLFTNTSSIHHYDLDASFIKQVTQRKHCWLWNADTGERLKLDLKDGRLNIPLGVADLKIIVFDNDKEGKTWQAVPAETAYSKTLSNSWSVQFQHVDGTTKNDELKTLADLKTMPNYVNFAGTAVYKGSFEVEDKDALHYINLGKVYGIASLNINGADAGTQWFGERIFSTDGLLKNGTNNIEIKITTTMGNYMKTLTDNKTAQKWTNGPRTNQPLQSMGLAGPVTIY